MQEHSGQYVVFSVEKVDDSVVGQTGQGDSVGQFVVLGKSVVVSSAPKRLNKLDQKVY